jgi:hypothetical protein
MARAHPVAESGAGLQPSATPTRTAQAPPPSARLSTPIRTRSSQAVSTPSSSRRPKALHEAHVIAAADAGLAILVEKPVAPDMAAMRRMAEAVPRPGVIAMAAHVERFEAGSAGLKTAIDQGICGQVSAIFARRQFGPAEVARFAGQSSTLRVLGIHDFDLVRWLHPGDITSVHAMAGRGGIHAAHGMDDHVVTTITFADGAMASVESGWTLPLAYQSYTTPDGWGAGATTGWRSSARRASCQTTCPCAPSP